MGTSEAQPCEGEGLERHSSVSLSRYVQDRCYPSDPRSINVNTHANGDC